jgi:hypothetical protein
MASWNHTKANARIRGSKDSRDYASSAHRAALARNNYKIDEDIQAAIAALDARKRKT